MKYVNPTTVREWFRAAMNTETWRDYRKRPYKFTANWWPDFTDKESPVRVDDLAVVMGRVVRFNYEEAVIEVATDPPTQVTVPVKCIVSHGTMPPDAGFTGVSASGAGDCPGIGPER